MSKKRIKVIRKFSEEFKLLRIREYESGEFTILQLSKIYNIRPQNIYNWIYKYSTYNKKNAVVVESKNSSSQKLKEQKKYIKELEQKIGQKQIKIDFLEKLVEIASEKLNYDIKKNSDSQPLNGLNKIEKK